MNPNDLLRTPKTPKSDESFLGFILRATEANGYETPAWILELAGINKGPLFASVFENSVDLNLLSMITGAELIELERMLYPSAGIIGNSQAHMIFGSPIPRYLIRSDRAKVCPTCLAESCYAKRVWDLVPFTACPTHGCLLIDTCPGCGKSIRWGRKHLARCGCNYDWKKAPAIAVPAGGLRLVTLIQQLCQPQEDRVLCGAEESANPLYRLNLRDLLKIVILFAIHFDSGRIDVTGKSLALSFTNDKLHVLLAKAFAVFDSWPDNFTRFLDTTFAKAGAIPTQGGLKTNFGRLYPGLYKGLASPEFDFIREAFEGFLAAQWSGELVHPRVLDALPNTFREKMHVGKTEAARVLQTSPSSMTRLVEKGLLEGSRMKGENKEVFVVERAVLEGFAVRKGKFLTAKKAAIHLGLDRKAIADLVKHDCLTPILDPSIDGSASYQFDESDVLGLLSKVDEAICPEARSRGKVISFGKASRVLSFAGYGVGRFVREVLDGKLPPCGVARGRGLARVRFLEKRVLEILRDSLQERRGGRLSITAASCLLGMDETGINILIKGNLLSEVTAPHDRRLGKLITAESIDDFLRRFASSVELARQLKSSPDFVLRLLAKHGVVPISGPNVDGGMRYFFRREDLSSSLLQKILGERKASKGPVRKRESRLLSAKNVAAQLGIPESQIRRLALTRELPPRLPKGRSMGRGIHLRFTQFDVERYKKRSSEGKDLVVSQKAAEMLGEDLSWFYRRWVRSGRLPKAEFQDELGAHYFRRSDVQKLVEMKMETVTGPEAGKMLCMHRTAVLKATKRKELIPVSGPDVDGFGRNLYLRHEVEAYAKGRVRPPSSVSKTNPGSRRRKAT